MRKIILSMLLLAGATTYAQVGINKVDPKATLDITVKTENATNNNLEGLLIPRVSKEKAYQMTTNVDTGNNKLLEESTLIYVNEVASYSGSDATVADITEKGYYFWNGIKWVKQTGKDGEEWVYNDATKRINLKRSGQGDFKNYIYYDTKTGQYINTDAFENIEVIENGAVVNKSLSDISHGKKVNFSLSENVPYYFGAPGNKIRLFETNIIHVTPTDDAKYVKYGSTDVAIMPNNSNNFRGIYPTSVGASLYGTGSITHAMALAGKISIGNEQKIVAYSSGLRGEVGVYGNAKVNRAYGVLGRVSTNSQNAVIDKSALGHFYSNMADNDNTLIETQVGLSTMIENKSQNSGEGVSIMGIENLVSQNGQTKYPNIYGVYSTTTIDPSAVKPTNLYGIYLGDVADATDKNYAIYTNTGDIRFGDLADSTPALAGKDRLVITNEDGVLSASSAVVDDFVSLWANDASKTQVVLKNTSDGTTARTDNNRVTISDAGAITAKAFIGYNGASIFPDYVFEKYYNGYSDIKADYNFHNLASVESFIKKNGHLPGYQSAKEIAKEGLIDLSATQLTNVEKIEELYLHTIEQEKKIEAKDAKIEKLENELKEQKARLERLEKLLDK